MKEGMGANYGTILWCVPFLHLLEREARLTEYKIKRGEHLESLSITRLSEFSKRVESEMCQN